MDYFLKVALGLLMMAATAAIVAWAFWRSLKKSEEPYALILKWILTVAAFILRLVGSPFETANLPKIRLTLQAEESILIRPRPRL